MFFFPSAVITGALTSLLFPSSSGRFVDFFRVLICPPHPRVPQFSPPGKVQPRREPCRTFQSASPQSLPPPHPTPTSFNYASAPDGQHGVDLPDEVPQLVHDLFQLLVLLLELLQGEKDGDNRRPRQ